MSIIDRIAERHISKAQQAGVFNNLPGTGKSLRLDDDRQVPEALRAGYRLLKNSGFIPPEIELRQELASVEQLIRCSLDAELAERHRRRLTHIQLKLALLRRP